MIDWEIRANSHLKPYILTGFWISRTAFVVVLDTAAREAVIVQFKFVNSYKSKDKIIQYKASLR